MTKAGHQAALLIRDNSSGSAVTWRAFIPLALAGLAVRIVAAPWTGHASDMGAFTGWAQHLADVGLQHFWDGKYWCDYLPGYLYVLWPLGAVYAKLPHGLVYLLFKLPNIAADIATAFLIWRMARPMAEHQRLWVPAIYIFNPAVFANSTLWGQADSFHAFLLVAALSLLVSRRALLSALVLGLAGAVKPHTAVVVPLVLIYAARARIRWHRIAASAGIAVAVFAATFLPFNGGSLRTLPQFIEHRIDVTMNQYQYASVNAMNLWYMFDLNWKPDSGRIIGPVTVHQAGTAICLVGYLFAAVWLWRRWRREGDTALWEATALAYLITFLFVTRAHERHLFPFFAPLAIVAARHTAALVPYVLASATYCGNLVFALSFVGSEQLIHRALAMALCLGNLLALPLTAISVTPTGQKWFDRLVSKLKIGKHELESLVTPADPPWLRRRAPLLLAVILLFALGTRLFRLNAPPERYFDEVYHAYTAEQWAAGNTDPWLWSTSAPIEGVAYEWTHPPLAKLFMQWSIQLFGDKPWAWRLPATLFGTIVVLLIYAISLRLFDRYSIALLAAALASLDTLPLVLSRIGMNDIYCAAFLLAAVLAGLYDRYVLAAFAVGGALACKWTALFAFPLMAVIHLYRAKQEGRFWPKRPALMVISYALLPAGIYLLSYTPFFRAGYSIDQFKELQVQMWSYHTGLTQPHPYSSKAAEWPLYSKMMWLYAEKTPPAKTAHGETASNTPPRSNVYAMGNPIIWLAGLAAIGFAALQVALRREQRALPLLAGYLAFWAPWLASPRIMFIYHYLPSLSFLYIALAWVVITARLKRGVTELLIVAGIAFALIYPYVTALPVGPPWWQSLLTIMHSGT